MKHQTAAVMAALRSRARSVVARNFVNAACGTNSPRRVGQVHWGRRHLYHRVGEDRAGDLPVFDGQKVLDGSIRVPFDKVMEEEGVCVLGT